MSYRDDYAPIHVSEFSLFEPVVDVLRLEKSLTVTNTSRFIHTVKENRKTNISDSQLLPTTTILLPGDYLLFHKVSPNSSPLSFLSPSKKNMMKQPISSSLDGHHPAAFQLQ